MLLVADLPSLAGQCVRARNQAEGPGQARGNWLELTLRRLTFSLMAVPPGEAAMKAVAASRTEKVSTVNDHNKDGDHRK